MSEGVFRCHSAKQERALFSNKRITVVGTGTQWGKGLCLDQLVLTASGFKPASEIREGDTLYDRNGKPTTVTGVFPQGLQECYRFKFYDGKTLDVDESHLNVIMERHTGKPLSETEKVVSTKALIEFFEPGRYCFPILASSDMKLYYELTAITPLGKKESVCFSVDSPTKTFTVQHHIVTHNTVIGAVRMIRAIGEYKNPDDSFIVTAPTYKILNQSTLVAFKSMAKSYGNFNEQKGVFNVHGGGTVYFRTEHDPDSIVGITNVRHIWGDEAGKYRLYFWENMQARSNLLGCPVDLTTSPYSLNWIYKQLIKPTLDGKRDDVELIQAASWENPYHSLHDPEERARVMATMDKRRFDMIFGGEWGQMVGRVYDCFDESLHVIEPFDLPRNTRFYAGIDWGFTQPFSLTVRAVTPTGLHIKVAEVHRPGLTIGDIKELCHRHKEIFGIQMFYCGPDQPGYIEELNRGGIPAVAANNDVRRGVDIHYQLIKEGKYLIFKGTSPHTLDEYETYHWPEPDDVGPDKDVKDQNPVKQNDHAMDAERYLTISLVDTIKKNKPYVISETKKTAERSAFIDKDLKRLYKPINMRTEDF